MEGVVQKNSNVKAVQQKVVLLKVVVLGGAGGLMLTNRHQICVYILWFGRIQLELGEQEAI